MVLINRPFRFKLDPIRADRGLRHRKDNRLAVEQAEFDHESIGCRNGRITDPNTHEEIARQPERS